MKFCCKSSDCGASEKNTEVARESSDLLPQYADVQTKSWCYRKCWVLQRKPWWICIAVLCGLITVGLGLWGVLAASQTDYNSRVASAYITAKEKALNVESVISTAFNPCVTMGTVIKQNPLNWTSLNQTFYNVAMSVLEQSEAFFNIQLAPNGIIMDIIPITGFQKAVALDLLQSPTYRPDAIKTIKLNALVMAGPTILLNGIQALLGRFPVFIDGVPANETFGFQSVLSGPPTLGIYQNGTYNEGTFNRSLYSPRGGNCSDEYCYLNETSSKFWGFVNVVVGWEKIKDVANLYDLCSQYDFIMTYTNEYGVPFVPIAMCSDVTNIITDIPAAGGGNLTNGTLGSYTLDDFLAKDAVQVDISALNNEWTLWVVDNRGWTPSYKTPLIILVVFGSFILTLMILLLMASHLEQHLMLAEQRAVNQRLAETKAVLEEEKFHTDALIKRQLDLISCFASNSDKKRPSSKEMLRTSMEASTLERIEAVRQQLNLSQNGEEEIQITALLGAGTFGKVYRGLWKGSEVAVKTIVLPANMGASAKQEKMAIMEAAISSSLTHPNIVQTYTYSIKPIKDSVTMVGPEYGSTAVLTPASTASFADYERTDSAVDGAVSVTPPCKSESDSRVFSYEVRLVIEYCNLGCLRTALDAGIFFSSCGFNFQAVLDTAADIARAMVHLHRSNVLHMDLKSQNVMLTSHMPGPEGGRGFIAKVADFGLSVSLDSTQSHMSSLFQGTLTHMAPEVIMKGTASKASDVYAFGITMWELLTGQVAFANVPNPHLGHAITAGKQRPVFSVGAPAAYRDLAHACWQEDVDSRPTFEVVLQRLINLREQYTGKTNTLDTSQLSALPKHSLLLVAFNNSIAMKQPPLTSVAEICEDESVDVLAPKLEVAGEYLVGGGEGDAVIGKDKKEVHLEPLQQQQGSINRRPKLSAPPLSPSAYLNTGSGFNLTGLVLGPLPGGEDVNSSCESLTFGHIGKPLEKVSEGHAYSEVHTSLPSSEPDVMSSRHSIA
ncbi:hypothetical protein CEUSTIGMA_g6782.t1 [Chlamydomonas eustigma]|uniref:Protein kinase domain-containing protein n=1 Tax=Chlamydomonas eustigma TaxID=1157962 RepID=A0A250X996_9CHLO|nr:hypothetical protein CEUSTIGMA_g6782.t1 [Chlamydomonas eustigma]|eukprot:GAX79340.1 hypothetical protein CEUSTIGMA_g6782.t1 [Chlamydomonas eustigma]